MAAIPAWLAAVEALLNRGIQSSPQGMVLARRLEATSLRLDVKDVPNVRAAVLGGRLLLSIAPPTADAAAPPADATITGSLSALWRLAGREATGRDVRRAKDIRGDGQGSSARQGRGEAQINGDAEIANLYRQLLTAAQPDWEEELSRIVGDMAARRLSRLSAGALDWARGTRATAAANIVEYLEEEIRLLATKTELEEFLRGVDEIREVAARVDARLRLLEQRHKGSS
jgi:ubiquinone biosynthesis protein UbiJ